MKHLRSKLGILLVLAMVTTSLTAVSVPAASAATQVVAFDMVGSASQNLTSYTNSWTGAFGSLADGFQKYQRGVSGSIPFSVLDDSLAIFPGDSLGIIKDGNTDEFFGATDTINGDNSGPVAATWVFDISGASDLSLSIDMGAMGDFESNDWFTWEYSIDGGLPLTAFASIVDEAASRSYTLEGGAVFALNDPMDMGAVPLSNVMAPVRAALAGSGSELTLTLSASTNGGGEAFTFQNIIISSSPSDIFSTSCGDDFWSVEATSGSSSVSATDSNDIASWVSAVSLSDPTPGTIELANATPAVSVGGTATADIAVSADVPAGVYTVEVTATNTSGDFATCSVDVSVLEVTLVSAVQGVAGSSPMQGDLVRIEGVVVGDFQDGSQFNGFHVQEEDSDADADVLTSEGIFVYDNGFGVDVAPGDVVEVVGTVAEFYGLTEITGVESVAVLSSGATVTPAAVALPLASSTELERYEGMSIRIKQELFISEFYDFGQYGEIVLTSERQYQPTASYEPDSAEATVAAEENSLGRITLDDGRSGRNPDPARHPNGADFDLSNLFRGGDKVSDILGVIDYSFGSYKLQPTAGATHSSVNQRSATPDDVGGDLSVATFNVLNYFTTIDGSVSICGPLENQGCRGADTAEEFERQRAKIISAIVAMDADVIGVMEIENHPTDAAMADLVTGLNDAAGAGAYSYVAAGPVGTDAIKNGLIYKPATVSPSGAPAILDTDGFLDPNNLGGAKNRAVIAQTFVENATGEAFTVAVNHLKSKGSSCWKPGDNHPEAGNCNLTRTLAAQVLSDWLAGDPTGSGDPDVLIIGDLNSYDKEDPIDRFLAGADDTLGTGDDYADLLRLFVGENAYTYVFDGQLGYLDYILASQSLMPMVTGVTAWHINADEPNILDYDMTYKKSAQDAIYAGDSFRSSDHDPVIVGLNLADPFGDKEKVIADLLALFPIDDRTVSRQVSKAIDAINEALTLVWASDQTITDKKVFDSVRKAIVQLELVAAGGGPESAAAENAIEVLVNAARLLAEIELRSAVGRGGSDDKIVDAIAAMAEASVYQSQGLYSDAVSAYKAAWDAATKA